MQCLPRSGRLITRGQWLSRLIQVSYSVSSGVGVLEEGVKVELRRVAVDEWPTADLNTQPPQFTALRGQPRCLQGQPAMMKNFYRVH